MSVIRSPHVTRLEAAYARDNEIFIIMELAESGSIADLIKERKDLSSRFDEDDLWRCLVQVFVFSNYSYGMSGRVGAFAFAWSIC